MSKLTLYTNPMSRGRIARWMLEEIGEPYEVKYLRYGEEMKGSAYTAINPMGKVPALLHGDQVVTECAAICAYLADVFPQAGLKPAEDRLGAYYRWFFFAAGPLEQAVTNKSMGFEPTPEQSGMAGYGNFQLTYDTLVSALVDVPYICGEQFTAADVYLGSQVGWGLGFGSLPPHPVLEAYRDRIYARATYQRATQLDDSAIKDYGPTPPAEDN